MSDGNSGIGVDRFVFGTMRIHELDRADAVALIRHLLLNDVRRFHSSHEYDSFEFFCSALQQACAEAEVEQGSLKHTVKLASPHFGEYEISETRIDDLVESYRGALEVDTIHQVQWMARINLEQEDLRLSLMTGQADRLASISSKLKDAGKINQFGCFPYTLGFAKAAIASGVFDNLVDYLNPRETMPLQYVEGLKAAGMGFLALRPFAAGAGFDDGCSAADLLSFSGSYEGLDGVIAGTGSIQHSNEILSAL